MSYTQSQLAAIFNEWARRYAEEPESFEDILDAKGNPHNDYGIDSAIFFSEIASDLYQPKKDR